jgi:integrase
MPKIAKELSPLAVRRLANRTGFHAVGGVAGLHLFVKDTGAASWVLRKMVGAERRNLGCGGYPTVGLKEAREEARRLVILVRQGIDPVADRKAASDALRAAQAKDKTFEQVARLCHAAKSPEFKNAKHAAQWIRTLETYVFPKIGRLPIAAVERPHVLAVLEPIWKTKTETATRVRQRIEAVLAYATVNHLRPEGVNPAAWLGNLQHALPKAAKLKQRESHAALPWRDMAGFMVRLRANVAPASGPAHPLPLSEAAKVLGLHQETLARWVREGAPIVTKGGLGRGNQSTLDPEAVRAWRRDVESGGESVRRALEFAILTAARSQEVRLATWDQVDLTHKVWTVPAELMKSKKLHRVPLSDAACALLRALPRRKGVELVFPSVTGKALSDSTLSKMLRDWNVPAVPHGFRSSFKDWAREACGTRYADEVSELALAHVDSNETRAAYARNELLEPRRKLMAEWAKHCATPAAAPATVTTLRRRG